MKRIFGFVRTSDRAGVDPVDNREVVSLEKLCRTRVFGLVAFGISKRNWSKLVVQRWNNLRG